MAALFAAALGCGRFAYEPQGAPGRRDGSVDGSGDTARDIRGEGGPDADGDAHDAAPPPLGVARALAPANGHYTGSVHAEPTEAASPPLRPELRWRATPGADHYVVQLGPCDPSIEEVCAMVTATTSATRWRPEVPLGVATTPPVGRRHYWRVRACAADSRCSEWTAIRYLNVGRLPNDYNGDGYGDLAVGAPRQAGAGDRAGRVYVYTGAPGGLELAGALASPGDQPDAYFGWSVAAVGDVNGDGFADLAVGAPWYSLGGVEDGAVFVYLGSAGGFLFAPGTVLGSPGRTAAGRFGISVAAAGDLEGDGLDDVIVGADLLEAAYVFSGRASGPAVTLVTELASPEPEPSGLFGAAVDTAGDVNGDGLADLVVGAPQAEGDVPYQGVGFVYLSSPGGPDTAPTTTLVDPTPTLSGLFARAVAGAGDMNDDGYGDVVVGAPGAGTRMDAAGGAYVFLGAESGTQAAVARTFEDAVAEEGARFGYAVAAAGDVNGDGLMDVAVGEDQRGPTNGGAVFAFMGKRGVMVSPTRSALGAEPNARLGAAIAAAGDVNGDGLADIVAGAPDSGGGTAFVFVGASGGSTSLAPWATLVNPDSSFGGAFGEGL